MKKSLSARPNLEHLRTQAKQLLSDAGFADGFSTNMIIPQSGSGMIIPVQMNEYIKGNLADVGIDVQIQSFEWVSYLGIWAQGLNDQVTMGNQSILTGRVYNQTNPVPYKLPENKTISTWKSDSSEGSNGFNEIKFEDKKGDELFEAPPTHQFETGKFREESMAFVPSVTIKDYTYGGSAGYPFRYIPSTCTAGSVAAYW